MPNTKQVPLGGTCFVYMTVSVVNYDFGVRFCTLI